MQYFHNYHLEKVYQKLQTVCSFIELIRNNKEPNAEFCGTPPHTSLEVKNQTQYSPKNGNHCTRRVQTLL